MTDRPEPTHLVVGRITKAHGTAGEVFVEPHTDHPEGSFSPGVVLLPGDETGLAPDWDRPPVRVDEVRPFKHGFLVFFGGVRDRNDAEVLRGLWLLRGVEDLEPLADGEHFYHDLIGLEVRLTDGTVIGEVRDVYEIQPFDLLEVRTRQGNQLVPYTREVVTEVDTDAGFLVIEPPEGLLELD